jgi:translation initiation factor 2 alpha subunit (eIF-2alpha)
VKLFDGIIKLKEILRSGVEAAKKKEFDVKITILGAPDYLCEI